MEVSDSVLATDGCVRLQAERRRRGWTQAQVALAVGVSRTLVAAWETGYRVPRGGQLKLLAALYEKSPRTILRWLEEVHFTHPIPKLPDLKGLE